MLEKKDRRKNLLDGIRELVVFIPVPIAENHVSDP